MAEKIAAVSMDAESARAAMEVLLEQERVLRYARFGASEALGMRQ